MSRSRRRWLGLGLVAIVGAGVMALTATMGSVFACGEVGSEVQLHGVRLLTTEQFPSGEDVGLVMGGSGLPLPNFNIPGYVDAANTLYIQPSFPDLDTGYPAPYADGLFTTEYGVLSMPASLNFPTATSGPLDGFPALVTSMGQGILQLENAIQSNQLYGDTSTVFGWSQSSTIAGLEMTRLHADGVSQGDLHFVLVGDPSVPNGGILTRFDGLSLPTLGLQAEGGGTPSDLYPTDIYTLEYDGWADFPRYPINVVSDLNALLGMLTTHGLYLNDVTAPGTGGPTPDEIAAAMANPLPGSALLGTPDSLTNYFMIPQTPPLITLLESIPVIGKPLADLLGPDLTYLINLGYGDGTLGYSDTPLNVDTPLGLFPDVSPTDVFEQLITGTQTGLQNLMSDLSDPSSLISAATPLSLPSLADLGTTAGDTSAPTITDIFNNLASIPDSLGTFLMQTIDIIAAATVSLPGYDLTLFLDNLADPVNAIGLPLAADNALLTMAAGFEFALGAGALAAVVDDITGLF